MGASDQGADPGLQRWMTIPRSLCFITNGNHILLMKRGMHKRVFPGRYNGIGGHLERDEDPLTGALREIQEETGLSVSDIQLRGITNVDAGNSVGILLFTFTATTDTWDVIDCEEGSLHWIALDALNDLPLVEDLPLLLPRLYGPNASREIFFAHVSYDPQDQIVFKFA